MQKVAQRLDLSGQAVNFPFGQFQRLAGAGFRRLGGGMQTSRAGQGRGSRASEEAERAVSVFWSAAVTSGAGLAISIALASRSLAGIGQVVPKAAFGQGGRLRLAATFMAGFVGIPVRQFGGELFELSFNAGQLVGQFSGLFFGRGFGIVGGGTRSRGFPEYFALRPAPRAAGAASRSNVCSRSISAEAWAISWRDAAGLPRRARVSSASELFALHR